jgi:hypothetical protein
MTHQFNFNKNSNPFKNTAASEWRTEGGEQMSASGRGTAVALKLFNGHIRSHYKFNLAPQVVYHGGR